jgi:epoxyqueuosine reductase QueG
MRLEQEIKFYFARLGADVCGIASVDRFTEAPAGFHPRDLYADCRSAILFGQALPRGTLSVDSRLLYLKGMTECLAELDRIAFLGSAWIERRGGVAVPLPSDSPYEHWDAERSTARGLLSLKHAAELAGLGRIGKSTLLINRQFGNRLMLGCMLTNLSVQSDAIAEVICLPDCRICLDGCPQHALDGQSVDQKQCRELIYGTNARGFVVNNCNRCRRLCPQAMRYPKPATSWPTRAELT